MVLYAAVALTALLAGTVQSLTGFGAAVVNMAVLPYFFDMTIAPTMTVTFSWWQPFYLLWLYRKALDLRRVWWPILLYCLVDIGAILLVGSMDLKVLTGVFGVFLVLLSGYFLFFQEKASLRPGAAAATLCGGVSGACAGLFGVGGPMMALYFVATSPTQEVYMASLQLLFVISNVVTLVTRLGAGYYRMAYVPVSVVGMLAVLAGTVLGQKLRSRISPEKLRRIIYIGVGVSGAATVVQQLL